MNCRMRESQSKIVNGVAGKFLNHPSNPDVSDSHLWTKVKHLQTEFHVPLYWSKDLKPKELAKVFRKGDVSKISLGNEIDIIKSQGRCNQYLCLEQPEQILGQLAVQLLREHRRWSALEQWKSVFLQRRRVSALRRRVGSCG